MRVEPVEVAESRPESSHLQLEPEGRSGEEREFLDVDVRLLDIHREPAGGFGLQRSDQHSVGVRIHRDPHVDFGFAQIRLVVDPGSFLIEHLSAVAAPHEITYSRNRRI